MPPMKVRHLTTSQAVPLDITGYKLIPIFNTMSNNGLFLSGDVEEVGKPDPL